ncbi:MAG: Nif3-like dinuclear metal center hexameric protein, partial [Ruminococcaceae bacterium]|nr:Nif3-like dinuclear metal center hexameric protein [Oscillospiraceae bacterium]
FKQALSWELRCDWDNDGIMCAQSLDAKVKRVLLALDVTLDTVEYAINNSFDTIISHHPLVFRSQKALSPLNYTQNKLIELIKNNINVMSFHTRLDAANGGVNDSLASIIGLNNVTVDPIDPIGRIGFLKDKISLSTFSENVKKQLNSPFVLYSGENDVYKVYVVGGDGKDLIDNAIVAGCDTILTGRASYNTAIDASDMCINIVEAGHFYTEHHVCAVLEEEICSLIPDIYTEIFISNRIKTI